MLKVQRLRIIIRTEKGDYGFDQCFNIGLNILASDNNTSGKSSIVNGFYYALGFEELIEGSGKGSKTLSQAYTKLIRIDDEENGKELPVLESEIQAELSNGKEVITIRRFAKHEKKKDNLITVYNSTISEMHSPMTVSEDMYLHMPGAAQNQRGFHRYFEEYLGLDLPEVAMTNGSECKLYLQTVFGAFFIEQKHGWGGCLSGVPYLGIAEVKKRIIEYILNLSTLANEKARKKIKREEEAIQDEWKKICIAIEQIARNSGIDVEKLPQSPILSIDEIKSVKVTKDSQNISDYLNSQKNISDSLVSVETRMGVANRAQIESELKFAQSDLTEKQIVLEEARELQRQARIGLNRTISSLEIIQTDLLNNKEAKRLKELGSQQGIEDFDRLCPTCGQEINDSLLRDKTVMSLEENIAHLQNQETLFKFSKQGQTKALQEVENNINELECSINSLRKLQSVLNSDLVKVKGDYSVANLYRKVQIDNTIANIDAANKEILVFIEKLLPLITRWAIYLSEKRRLGSKSLSTEDSQTLYSLGGVFASLLKDFGYRSTQHFDAIKISEDTFLPTINGFDMRYDSSASDELRNIWAFTLALLDMSIKKNGNHPRILIYDEPKQQSVVDESFKILCEKLINFGHDSQIIIGVTAFDDGVKKVIGELEKDKFNYISIGNRAFKKL